MPAQQLSAWTMAWFATALLFLLMALALALTGAGGPGDWQRGAGLAVVHLFALGGLGSVMLGALIQFVPVLTALPLAWPGLALPALLATTTGTLALAGGFLSLDGLAGAEGLFLAAPWLLALGFALVMAMILPPLCARGSLRLTEVRMVLLALLAVTGLWASGAAMALDLSGVPTGFVPDGLPLHILFGMGGWLSLAAFGVSYKLFSMFLMAPEQGGRLRQAVFVTAGLALALLMAAMLALAIGAPLPGQVLALFLPLTAILYLAEITRIWHLRRRPKLEGNMLWSRAALAFLGLSALLVLPALARGGVWAEAAIFAGLTGWLTLLTLAQMLKITSFLTWLQVFAPRIGRAPVPLVQELTDPRAATRWLTLWTIGAAGGTLSLLLTLPLAFRLSLAALLLAALGLAVELFAIRRLAHVAPGLRPAAPPPLLFPVPQPEIRR